MLQTFSPISISITLHKEYAMHDALKVKRHVATNQNIILTQLQRKKKSRLVIRFIECAGYNFLVVVFMVTIIANYSRL